MLGDKISEMTGVGRTWIGMILMASVTSLPELFVGVSSAAIARSADLAVGDILGSCVFNLAIFSLMDVLSGRKKVFSYASKSILIAAAFSIVLLSLAGIGLFLPYNWLVLDLMGVTSVLFIIIYFVSMRLVYKAEMEIALEPDSRNKDFTTSERRRVYFKFAINALFVIVSAIFLPQFSMHIAEQAGIGTTFFGTFFLAISTSLPEVVVSVAAVRAGFVSLAMGNLLGSNIFNILILAIDDIVYTGGHILVDASNTHIISVFSTIIMTGIAMIGFSFNSAAKRFFLAWDTFLIAVIYILNLLILYKSH